MNFTARPESFSEFQPKQRSHGRGVAGWSAQTYSDSRARSLVAKELSALAILTYGQVDASVAIIVRHGQASLLSIYKKAAGLAWHSLEAACPIPF